MRAFKSLLLSLVPFIVTYIGMSFYLLKIDFRLWESSDRGFISIFSILLGAMLFVFGYFEFFKNK